MTLQEKILVLAALFHDIGKFEQRCTNRRIKHEELGAKLLFEFKDKFLPILGNDEKSFNRMMSCVAEHHNSNTKDELTKILRGADHLSASERVEFSETENDLSEKWSHKYLSSLFSKIYLNNNDGKTTKYYRHRTLDKKEYKILIPEYDSETDIKESGVNYTDKDFNEFKNQLKSVLAFYKEEKDFMSLANLILILFEKFMWCIPDFTGSDKTDISLYNHLKDVAGISLALLKSESKEKLNLIIGDLPGIQNYIFANIKSKPAQILRGRSIFVQLLTRNFASIFLNSLGLTEANVIMLAGGKFYILAQDSKDFESRYNEASSKIESYLIENFNYELSFSSAFSPFSVSKLKDRKDKFNFGDVIDEVSYKLLQQRNKPFVNNLFGETKVNFILNSSYIEPKEDSDSIKCDFTDKPIRKGREIYESWGGEDYQLERQVYNEWLVGRKIPYSDVIIGLNEDYNKVLWVEELKDYSTAKHKAEKKILLNPELDNLLKPENLNMDLLRDALILEVANFSTKGDKHVLEFEKMAKSNVGAEFLTLIKGDVDNLGLIMSSGLVDDIENFNAISRTTTLSNHLKYFFGFTMNGFLRDWDSGKLVSEFDDNTSDQRVYTVFAGGDDLLLVAPQSSSLKLVYELNKTFNDFVCNNPEVHMSYSLTNFKDHTPIRLMADIAEENQSVIKNSYQLNDLIDQIEKNKEVFHAINDKSGTLVFSTPIKNDFIPKLIEYKKNLVNWVNNEENRVTKGVVRNLLNLSQIMKEFSEKQDTRLLIWHPKLTYMINRLLKDKSGKYINPEVEEFFNTALNITKNDPEAVLLESLLYPVVCETIYALR
ncbi:MAG: type III-A CRISPR-associated protein Cas10/Csm1 [Melioribacteraceae bacterium]|nr:type III-A CRISPR-associated protein Cas10/Csm1 [Melioribacteraceae bacterium]